MIMLAATTTERIHCQERASIIDTGPMILRITHYLIGTGNVSQCLKSGITAAG